MKEETMWAFIAFCLCALIGTLAVSWHIACVKTNAACVAAGKDYVDGDCREAGLVRK